MNFLTKFLVSLLLSTVAVDTESLDLMMRKNLRRKG